MRKIDAVMMKLIVFPGAKMSLIALLILFNVVYAFKMELLRSDGEGFSFVLDYTFEKSSAGGSELPAFDDHWRLDKPGYPRVPLRVFNVAVPQDAHIELSYNFDDTLVFENIYIPPAETIFYTTDSRDEYARLKIENPAVYEINEYFPKEFVELECVEHFRSQRIASIIVYPLRFNPVLHRAIMAKRIEISLGFNSSGAKGTFVDEGQYEYVLNSSILNYEESKTWRRPTKKLKRALDDVFGMVQNWIKFKLEDEGIYKVTGADLERRGIRLSSIDPQTIKLFAFTDDTLPTQVPSSYMPTLFEIPFESYGLDDMRFDRNDYICFYSRGPTGWRVKNGVTSYFTHPYTKSYAVWFSWGWDSAGKKIETFSYTPSNAIELRTYFARKHFEADIIWQGGTNWVWDRFSSRRFFFFDPAIVPNDSAFIFVKPNCRAVLVDGSPALYMSSFSGFFTDALKSSSEIEINYAGETALDWFEVKYKRYLDAENNELFIFSPSDAGKYKYIVRNFGSQPIAYDITDPLNIRRFIPQYVAQGEYFFTDSVESERIYLVVTQGSIKTPSSIEPCAISSLRSSNNSAQMLILTADQFDISRLADFHRVFDSLVVRVVKLSDIMDQFGFGIYSPVAVRNFIFYAYNYWTPPDVIYVVLVGDGHYDYRNILGSPTNYFPPPGCDRYFSDDFYVRMTDSNNGLPAIAIGRLPVRSQAELDVIIDKIISYAKAPEYGFWRNTFVLAGDDEYVGYEGNQPEHTIQTDELRKYIYPLANIRNLFMIEFPMSSGLTKPQARETLIEMWNEGALVVNYTGHGNYHLWAHEVLFDSNSDVARLRNRKRLPLMFSASCSVGEYYEPFRESTSEKLLRHPDGGTIISIGATQLTGSDANFSLNTRLFKKLFIQSPQLSCGLNLVAAKLEGGGIYRINDSQYLIIGDPAVKLAVPKPCEIRVGIEPESFDAPGWVRLFAESEIEQSGEAQIYAFDSEIQKQYTLRQGTEITITYHKQGNPIFRGIKSFSGSGFELMFFVPKDVNYGANGAKLVNYILAGNSDCICGLDSIYVTGSTLITTLDTIGPDISIWIDDRSFISGDSVSASPTLFIELSDSHGINITGGPGHSIVLSVDNARFEYDLTPYFSYYSGSSTKGSITYKIDNLQEGEHTLTVRAWDNMNNSNSKTVRFFVVRKDVVPLANVLPYPNPFNEHTYITFRLLSPGMVSVEIFTVTGRKIWSYRNLMEPGFNMVRWDGVDKRGMRVGKGIYLFRVVAKNGNNDYIVYGKVLKE